MIATTAPGMKRTWMQSLESLLEASTTINRLFALEDEDSRNVVRDHGFMVDRALLKHAAPFAWSNEPINATIAASQSIPLDAQINHWNLPTSAVWWYFDTPLPIHTFEIPEVSDVGVRALCIGWMMVGNKRALGCATWCDSHDYVKGLTITPSQTWTWPEDHTLEQVIANTSEYHRIMYGPGGKHERENSVSNETFTAAVEALSRFILAGMAWLDQKILVSDDGHIERHRRKAFNRATGQNLDAIKLVQLRKTQRAAHGDTPTGNVDWSCRWVVDGHWRHQVCGPKNAERKLIYVHPYTKGPEGKELKIPSHKVYVVSR